MYQPSDIVLLLFARAGRGLQPTETFAVFNNF
jgi:hypothetical protein